MGLALHNPSDTVGFSNLTEDRPLPARSYLDKTPECSFGSTEGPCRSPTRRESSGKVYHRTRSGHSSSLNSGKPLRVRQLWDLEAKEGRDLARSSFRLPSDGHRGRRPPSLERQEAFRDGRTSKKRTSSLVDANDDVGDVADLYRLGLLYDDEHERGPGFTLDAIAHREPLYRLNVRPAKRGRRAATVAENSTLSDRCGLPLDLSFAALGDDEALARFLVSPADDELAQEEVAIDASTFSARGVCRPFMTAIYELEPDGSTSFSLHNSTSPAPNSSTGTHTPTRSLIGSAPEADCLPDLISDNSQDNDNREDKEEDDDDDEWEVIRALNMLAHQTQTTTRSHDTETTTELDDTSPSTNPDAWVVLG